VVTTTLRQHACDNCIPRFSVVKVDVEGFELEVINVLPGAGGIVYFGFNPWSICFDYRRNPLEALEVISNSWRILVT
jgi:hypothetical protein